jgi:hypothetical protein
MNITRRQFGLGVLWSILALAFGRIFGGCKSYEEPEVKSESAEARYWSRGDRLAG